MKKIFLLFSFLIISILLNNLYSQTEKGRLIYGGTGSFFLRNFGNTFCYNCGYGVLVSVTPQLGRFVSKNVAVLGFLDFKTTGRDLVYGVGPEFRYYIGDEKLKFYLFANTAPGGVYYHSGPQTINRFNLSGSGGAGLAVFAGPNFSIHSTLYFRYDLYIHATVGLGISFYGLLTPGNKKETLK